MKLSTRAQYGTRLLLDLALNANGAPVHLKDVARRQQISLQYLEHLVTPLAGAGLVRTMRGPNGGVSLLKPPQEISLSEVVGALEGRVRLVECIERPESCTRAESCAVRDLWSELGGAMDSVLGAMTLQELAERQRSKEQKYVEMYHI